MAAQITKARTPDPIDAALAHISRSEGIEGLESAFLDIAPRVMNAGAYGIYTLEDEARLRTVRVAHLPDGFVNAYEGFGRANDLLFRYIAAHGAPAHDRSVLSESSWLHSPIGRFLDEWGFAHTTYAPVVIDGALAGTLHFGRAKPAEAFRQGDLRIAALIARQVAQQLRWIRTEHELRMMRGLCSSLLEGIEIPAVVTGESGELVEANGAARSLLLSYRDRPALWDEFARAVRRNAAAISHHGRDAGGTEVSRRGAAEPTYSVRTTGVAGSGLLLSLFHPSVHKGEARHSLLAREQVIACMVAAGSTNDRIALTLGISVNTVKDRLKRINRKLGIDNRAQLAAWAQRNLAPPAAPDA
jgi:DNA-binding CsgD family transcriptional regulator